jgi:integrase
MDLHAGEQVSLRTTRPGADCSRSTSAACPPQSPSPSSLRVRPASPAAYEPHQWVEGGRAAERLSILRDFFKYAVLHDELHGDPTLAIERARNRDPHRTTFSPNDVRAIIASQDDVRDRLAVRLLLDYGLRKGSLAAIQFKHFDHYRRRLTIFAKGGKVRELPIPSKPFWNDLERYIVEIEAKPSHYLMARQKTIPRAGVVRFPDKPMSGHGLHDWWYRCLARLASSRLGRPAARTCTRRATPPVSAS